MDKLNEPKLIFKYGFDEYDQADVRNRGYLEHVQVLLKDTHLYSVTFYAPVRLGQELEDKGKFGDKFIAEPGMIVIPEITLDNMQAAINKLEKRGFFNHLVSLEKS